MMNMLLLLTIDGSHGEGGGQIVRTAVTLSAIAGKPIRIINIRAKRQIPGLHPQHVAAVKAVADLFCANTENLRAGADWIKFIPTSSEAGNFEYGVTKIDIGTAGSIPLVLLTIIPAISISGKSHSLQVIGGTDVRFSPTIDYLRYVVREAYGSLGIRFSLDVCRRGYYPTGGGIADVEISAYNPSSDKPLNLAEGTINDITEKEASVSPLEVRIANVCCKLPRHVAERQISSAISTLEKNGVNISNPQTHTEMSLSPGTSILIYGASRNNHDCRYIGGDSIGERGKRAESVGIEASQKFLQAYLQHAQVDSFLADMLVVPLGLIKVDSRFRVAKVTEHLKTNLYIASQIVPGFRYHIESAAERQRAGYIVTIENEH